MKRPSSTWYSQRQWQMRVRRLIKVTCMECLGTGHNGRGEQCKPCKGTGEVERWINEIVWEEDGK